MKLAEQLSCKIYGADWTGGYFYDAAFPPEFRLNCTSFSQVLSVQKTLRKMTRLKYSVLCNTSTGVLSMGARKHLARNNRLVE